MTEKGFIMPKKPARKLPNRSAKEQKVRASIQRELANSVSNAKHPDQGADALNRALVKINKIPSATSAIRVFEIHKFLSKRKNWIYIRKYKVFENVLAFVPDHQKPALILRMVKTMAKATGFLSASEVYDAVTESVRNLYPESKFPGKANKFFSETADLVPRVWKNLPLFDQRRALRIRMLNESGRHEEAIKEMSRELNAAKEAGDTTNVNLIQFAMDFWDVKAKEK